MGTQDSLDVLISMGGGASYVKEFMGEVREEEEEEEEDEEGSALIVAAKKRRLSVQQVRWLEKTFEVENKLEPNRKMQLAKDLGLQPRQVAVWFQNRRARWKTKQLEKDYSLLKLNYDSLKSSFDEIQQDTNKLAAELASLKRKWEETGKRKVELKSGKEDNNSVVAVSEQQGGLLKSNGVIVFNEKFEGSESDSSAILNDHVAVATGNSSPRPIDSHIRPISSLKHSTIHIKPSDDTCTSNDIKISQEGLMEILSCTKQSCNSNHIPSKLSGAVPYNEQQYSFKDEDNEESCNFFNVDDPAAATLPWWEWA